MLINILNMIAYSALLVVYPFVHFVLYIQDILHNPIILLRFWDFNVVHEYAKGYGMYQRTYHTGGGYFWLSVVAVLSILVLRRQQTAQKKLLGTGLFIFIALYIIFAADALLTQKIFL